ncbi:hypothetical protein J5N97_023050 [Dioscorea zingiberensis]|uniref:Uncharacterized protein n=1 Tax=Dioscorea zingiberensis TaxID=325984 RepID=A0A9D5HBK1_9LILI|nr:hypothetical protein J5N97_023050 [Dioscorea zingiberensis]
MDDNIEKQKKETKQSNQDPNNKSPSLLFFTQKGEKSSNKERNKSETLQKRPCWKSPLLFFISHALSQNHLITTFMPMPFLEVLVWYDGSLLKKLFL